MNSRMARPLASVSLVRVSLTVSTKQQTDAGALALCSWWLTVVRDYRRRRTSSPTSRTSIVFKQRLSLHGVRRWLYGLTQGLHVKPV